MNMQKKILDKMEQITQNLALDFVISAEYSNTGIIYIQKGFKTYIAFSYNFQPNHVNFTIENEFQKHFDRTSLPYNEYQNAYAMTQLFKFFTESIQTMLAKN